MAKTAEQKLEVRRAYNERNKERLREWRKEYDKRPEIIAKNNSPEYKARRKAKNKKYFDNYVKKDPIRFLINNSKGSAKRRGIEFSITKEDIIWTTHCPITGLELKIKEKDYFSAASLDRIDNSKGYVPGNVRIISVYANRLKSNLTIEMAEKFIKYMKGEI